RTCDQLGGCQMREDGTEQTGITITWSNGTKDTIKFASDVESTSAVPEPSSVLLVGSGLLGLVGSVRRKLLG
ncbi:MAG: PEP-CTERM sorting domain-containing protein, partial [Candidatus Acidiferrales bacterium]